ncbi:MAG: NAD(P)H-dependent oxidoreductase [Pseudobdellovibrionaceae bacterium]|nr:NAD(P)H-dependent oxidoreductase [Pseudobdellovibrionaceae bacterium]
MRILILQGHPDAESFCASLAGSYKEGALAAGHECRLLSLQDMKFDPNLAHGYRQIQELEPDLVKAQEWISWCEHLVVIYPIWWGQMPALLKGFFDRCFLPGWAFKYHKNDPFWDRLLSGRSAHLIVTSDGPVLYNILAYWDSPVTVPRKMILRFCGFKPVRVSRIGSIKYTDDHKRRKILERFRKIGMRGR